MGKFSSWQVDWEIHIKMCICAICLQGACCMFINYCPLMCACAVCHEQMGRIRSFSNDAGLQQTSSFVLLHSSTGDECCFLGREGEGRLSKLRWSFITQPPTPLPGQNMCNTTCMFHDVSNKAFWAAKTSQQMQFCFCCFFFAFALVSRILILLRGLWFSLFWLYQDMFMV